MSEELDIRDLAAPLPPGTTLIEASAGTGKTYTIAAIFLRLVVEHGLEVDRILVTTFTKPATAELRDRIRRRLREAEQAFAQGASADPLLQALLEHRRGHEEEARRRLRAAVRGFDEAAIDTIHAFCQRVLTRYAFESGMAAEPEFLHDESQLLHEVAYDYWRRRFYACHACLAAAARAQSLSAAGLAKLLADHLKKPTARVHPKASAAQLERAQAELSQTLEELRACWKRGAKKIRGLFFEENDWAKSSHSPRVMEGIFASVETCLGSPEGSLGQLGALLHFAADTLDKATRAAAETPAHPFFDLCEKLEQQTRSYKLAVEADFLQWAPGELAQRKERANLLSYGDLLSRLHAELHSPRGAALVTRLRAQYAAALIDEFQDTDPLQNEIFTRIFGAEADWLFLIGDPKQAIYGFRGADVFTYLSAAQQARQRRTLRTNFRSTAQLVDAVNAVFAREKEAFVVEGIHFQPAQADGQKDGATIQGAPLRLWHWEEEVPSPEELGDSLGAATAGEIARLLAKGRLGERRIVPSDLAVLTDTNDQAADMQVHLRRLGVPSALLNTASVFQSREARELLTLLHAVVQPRDERRLRAALLTDLLGLDMRQVHAFTDEGTAWDRQSAQFHTWHEAWRHRGFIGMFRRVLRDTGARARLLAREDGERRLTNLSHLAELLQRVALEEQLTPPALLKWLAGQMAEVRRQEEHELRLERDDDAVRIVTVHKSKGLEYNIVFCPFLWTRGCGAKGERLHYHNTKGELVFDLGDQSNTEALPSAETERLAEGVRLLYVALTRARHRCDLAVGKFPRNLSSALNWVLQGAPPKELWQSLEGGGLHPILKSHYAAIGEMAWRERLQSLTAAAPIVITPIPAEKAPRYRPAGAGEEPAPRVARQFQGNIERDFAVSSFSSLTQEGGADEPERFAPSWTEDTARLATANDIHAFPSGARPGTCLHELFEQLDFTQLGELERLVAIKLSQHGFDAARWTAAVTEGVRAVLAAKMPGGFCLSAIPAEERLMEREFHLPVHRLEARALHALLGGAAEERLEFSPRTGWLKGYIDLVFRHSGRFYLVDWKSNRLGLDASGYTPENVAAAMASHHYPLQAQIYGLALHRYLRQRLPAYDYDRHFGGMMYLFVRGIGPEHPANGIWHARPERAAIEKLDQWLAGAQPPPRQKREKAAHA